ncbi:MAG TPA: hypothetical protein VGM41_12315 [Chitinophagaceae bacterium]|jgi:hypothetical protein
MIKKISRTDEIKAKLKAEGKVSYLDKPHHVQAIVMMNEQMEAVRREYQDKDRNSQNSAAGVTLTS